MFSKEKGRFVETTVTRIIRDKSRSPQPPIPVLRPQRSFTNHYRHDAKPAPYADTSRQASLTNLSEPYTLQSSFSRPVTRDRGAERPAPPPPPPRFMDSQYLPPPLSPVRPLSPVKPSRGRSPEPHPARAESSLVGGRLAADRTEKGHVRAASRESTSWLDPIDESARSEVSSVHSRSSRTGARSPGPLRGRPDFP